MKHKNGWKQMILFCLTALLLFSPISAQARAGGGGSSSSSSGGGGGSSSSSHSSNYDDHNYRRSSRGRYSNNPMSSVIQYAIFICIASGGTIVFFYHRKKARLISKHRMTEFAKYGYNWDYKEIQQRGEQAYFQIQECWRRQDADYAATYLSPSLLDDFRMKLEWMDTRNEQVVQEQVQLLSADPVYVDDHEGTEQDQIWYLIHGKMIGYYIDKDTKLCIRGNTNPESFYEYWRFIYLNNNWVLDEIRQKDELDIRQFSNL